MKINVNEGLIELTVSEFMELIARNKNETKSEMSDDLNRAITIMKTLGVNAEGFNTRT